jgi:hypothetical protein
MFHPTDPLLDDITAVALGEDALRPQVEARLARLEDQGWHLSAVVQRIWAGERDLPALSLGLDSDDLRALKTILEQISDLENPPETEPPSDETPDEAQADEALAQRWESLPEELRLAVVNHDAPTLLRSLRALPPHEAQAALDLLTDTGLLEGASAAELLYTLDEFTPMLHAIATVITCDPDLRPQVEDFLASLEANGWNLRGAIQRLWEGERDADKLAKGLSQRETVLVQYVLEMVGE